MLALYSVILNAVKNLLRADHRQPSLIAHNQRGDASPSLSMTYYERLPYVVILNAVKNLLEADQRQPALIAHSQRGDASTSLSMTTQGIITNY